MSQGVFGWRTKVTGLGLLGGVVLLSGATCWPPSLDLTGGQTGGQQAQTSPWSITVESPLQDMTILAGTVVQISWTAFTNGQPAKVTVFYDTDNNFANGVHNLQVVDLSSPAAPNRYNWSTTGLANGTYYAGAQLSDGTTSLVSYAIGRVIVTGSVVGQAFSLDRLGKDPLKGCVFEGFSFGGYLGRAMAGRFDISSAAGTTAVPTQGAPDGISDFVIIAPKADSHYIEDPNSGEGYLIFGWDRASGNRSNRWYNGGHLMVNSVGTDPDIPGTILVGPGYISDSAGIVTVQPVADVDGDRGAELMFGTPYLLDGRQEHQDYDPADVLSCGLFFPPKYWNAPWCLPEVVTLANPDFHDLMYGGLVWSGGYVSIMSSTSPLYDPTTGLGSVIHVDDVGEALPFVGARDNHPRTRAPVGLRIHPRSRVARYYDFLQNDYRFANSLGIEDVDGDGQAEWLIGAPRTDDDLGEVTFHFTSQMLLWTAALPNATTSCYSWPYATCPDRTLVWPDGLLDRLIGDATLAQGGQLENPVGIGDWNNDGLGDVAAAAWKASLNGVMPEAGIAYLIFGRAPFGDHSVADIKNPAVQKALSGVMIRGTAAGDRVGWQMTGLGRPNWGMPGSPRLRDFNADGLSDWVIAAPKRSVPGLANVGAVAIVFGHNRLDGRFTWDQIGTADLPGVIITGANQGDEFGTYIAEAGDINGDGSDDLLVASPGAENPLTGAQDTGAIYIIYGPPSAGATVNKYQALSGTYSVADLMASGPIKVQVIYGMTPGHKIGPVAGAGDIDNDGFEDILIADPLASPLGRTAAGQVYLIFGGAY
jgi:hypothetical protein